MKITLDEGDFRDLVAGRTFTTRYKGNLVIEIALADIGFQRMFDALCAAMGNRELDISMLIRTRRPIIEDRDDED
jgi:hypothetical protein